MNLPHLVAWGVAAYNNTFHALFAEHKPGIKHGGMSALNPLDAGLSPAPDFIGYISKKKTLASFRLTRVIKPAMTYFPAEAVSSA